MNKRDELLVHVNHPPYPYAHDTVSLDTLREFLADDIEDLKHDDAVNATAIATEETRATGVEEDLEDRIEDLESFTESYVPVTVSSSEPTSYSTGSLWYDTTNTVLKVRTSSAWVTV